MCLTAIMGRNARRTFENQYLFNALLIRGDGLHGFIKRAILTEDECLRNMFNIPSASLGLEMRMHMIYLKK